MKLNIFKIIILFSFGFTLETNAQENYDITYEDASYKFGVEAGPNGMGVFFRNVKPRKNGYSYGFDISFTGIRNVKEKSILNQRLVNSSPYIYGKVNRLYALRPKIGFQKSLAEKQNKNSIGINLFAFLGPDIGLLKPIYMDIESFDPNAPFNLIASSVRYNPEIHKHEKITGYSSFGKGINETKIIAGITLKTGVEFNWGYYSSEFKSLEVGILIDYFPGRPEIMHFVKNKIVYSSFYLSFAFGKNY